MKKTFIYASVMTAMTLSMPLVAAVGTTQQQIIPLEILLDRDEANKIVQQVIPTSELPEQTIIDGWLKTLPPAEQAWGAQVMKNSQQDLALLWTVGRVAGHPAVTRVLGASGSGANLHQAVAADALSYPREYSLKVSKPDSNGQVAVTNSSTGKTVSVEQAMIIALKNTKERLEGVTAKAPVTGVVQEAEAPIRRNQPIPFE